MDGLDDVLVITGEVEEGAALSRGAELREDVFRRQGHKVIAGVEAKVHSQVPEDPRCVILKLEVVFGRGSQLISSSNIIGVRKITYIDSIGTHISNENLCFASKSASVSSRSIFAFVRETQNRIPVNMLYAVTQFT